MLGEQDAKLKECSELEREFEDNEVSLDMDAILGDSAPGEEGQNLCLSSKDLVSEEGESPNNGEKWQIEKAELQRK